MCLDQVPEDRIVITAKNLQGGGPRGKYAVRLCKNTSPKCRAFTKHPHAIRIECIDIP